MNRSTPPETGHPGPGWTPIYERGELIGWEPPKEGFKPPFVHPRYEYTTRTDDSPERDLDDPELSAAGWQRVYADICLQGRFAVYRRQKADWKP